jgi:hypothetical protein
VCPDELDEGGLPSKIECHDHPITANYNEIDVKEVKYVKQR